MLRLGGWLALPAPARVLGPLRALPEPWGNQTLLPTSAPSVAMAPWGGWGRDGAGGGRDPQCRESWPAGGAWGPPWGAGHTPSGLHPLPFPSSWQPHPLRLPPPGPAGSLPEGDRVPLSGPAGTSSCSWGPRPPPSPGIPWASHRLGPRSPGRLRRCCLSGPSFWISHSGPFNHKGAVACAHAPSRGGCEGGAARAERRQLLLLFLRSGLGIPLPTLHCLATSAPHVAQLSALSSRKPSLPTSS